MHPSAATDVYTVSVSAARQLTNDIMVKKALELQLDVTVKHSPKFFLALLFLSQHMSVGSILEGFGWNRQCNF